MYTIDSATVVCPTPQEGQTISVPIPGPGSPDYHRPHVLSFYRESSESVQLGISAADNMGKPVIARITVNLAKLSRRLSGVALNESEGVEVREGFVLAEESREVRPNADKPAGAHPDSLEDDDEEEESHVPVSSIESAAAAALKAGGGKRAPPRRLSGRRRVGSAPSPSYSAPSPSYSAPSPSLSTPRRRAVAPAPPPPPDVRRRANPVAARRRGAPSNDNAPVTGVGGSRFENRNGQAYGYTSSSQLNSNFGGGSPMVVAYGYTGANAWTPSVSSGYSTANVHSEPANGWVDDSNYMTIRARHRGWGRSRNWCYCRPEGIDRRCAQCYRMYSYADCPSTRPSGNMNRDDLMNTGFWPADYTGPINVTIHEIMGPDFQSSSACPPANWDTNSSAIAGNIGLYMLLTVTDELRDNLEEDEGFPVWAIVVIVIGSLLLLACCAAGVYYMLKQSSARGEGEGQAKSVEEEPYSQQVGKPAEESEVYQGEGRCAA